MEDYSKQEELLERYKNGQCTEQEKALVEQWYNSQSATVRELTTEPSYPSAKQEIWEAINAKIDEETSQEPEKSTWKLNTKRILVAASVFISLAVGTYYYSAVEADHNELNNAQASLPVTPGGNKAYLTLSNGKRILLTDSTIGTLAVQSGVQITKTADGQLIYEVTGDAAGESGKYNTLEAPKGGQYQIVLIDGTRVWLNSASKLKYPASFSTTERVVELEGEAYFEVAKNKDLPFRIRTADQEIQVLGTHFNVAAYVDESNTKTTLIEGSVSVSRGGEKGKILSPGQQSVLQNGTFLIQTVDTEEAIAWKNGYFIFENDNTEAIMRKLERWYDVDIIYQGMGDPRTKVMGAISRNTQLNEILDLLEATGKFKFKTEGRRIIIMP